MVWIGGIIAAGGHCAIVVLYAIDVLSDSFPMRLARRFGRRPFSSSALRRHSGSSGARRPS